jgi:hypothetical protein
LQEAKPSRRGFGYSEKTRADQQQCRLCRCATAGILGAASISRERMIFTSESGLADTTRAAEWSVWYRGHLAAMAAVPGIGSAQRFLAVEAGPPPSLAIYTVVSAAVFNTEIYLRTRGMGPWLPLIDRRHYHRNLFDGLERAPQVSPGGILFVAVRDAPTAAEGMVWLRSVGLDRSTAYRGLAVLPDAAAARRLAAGLGGPVGLYRPITERFEGATR